MKIAAVFMKNFNINSKPKTLSFKILLKIKNMKISKQNMNKVAV